MPALLHDSYIMPPHTNPLEIGAVSGIQSLQEVWKKNPWLWVLDLRKDDAINSKFTKLPLHQYVSQSYSRLWLSWFRAKTGLKSVELVEINRVHNRCTLSWQNAHIPDRGSLKCFWQKPFPSSRQWIAATLLECRMPYPQDEITSKRLTNSHRHMQSRPEHQIYLWRH